MLRSRADADCTRRSAQHGEETYPHECCGVLLGSMRLSDGNAVEAAVRAGNTRTDSAHNRYNIAPQELMRIQRQARERGWILWASITRIRTIRRSGRRRILQRRTGWAARYVITGVEKGAAKVTNSFLLTGTSEEDKLEDSCHDESDRDALMMLTAGEAASARKICRRAKR